MRQNCRSFHSFNNCPCIRCNIGSVSLGVWEAIWEWVEKAILEQTGVPHTCGIIQSLPIDMWPISNQCNWQHYQLTPTVELVSEEVQWDWLKICYRGSLQNSTGGWPPRTAGSARLPLFKTIATAQNRRLRAVNRRLSFEVIPRGKWGNAGSLSISPYKYKTNHGNTEQSSSLSRIGHTVTSDMSTTTFDP